MWSNYSSPSTIASQGLKRQAIENNQELQLQRERLELREKAAEIERQGLANLRERIDLEERKARSGIR